jgi:hypothetical protein
MSQTGKGATNWTWLSRNLQLSGRQQLDCAGGADRVAGSRERRPPRSHGRRPRLTMLPVVLIASQVPLLLGARQRGFQGYPERSLETLPPTLGYRASEARVFRRALREFCLGESDRANPTTGADLLGRANRMAHANQSSRASPVNFSGAANSDGPIEWVGCTRRIWNSYLPFSRPSLFSHTNARGSWRSFLVIGGADGGWLFAVWGVHHEKPKLAPLRRWRNMILRRTGQDRKWQAAGDLWLTPRQWPGILGENERALGSYSRARLEEPVMARRSQLLVDQKVSPACCRSITNLSPTRPL